MTGRRPRQNEGHPVSTLPDSYCNQPTTRPLKAAPPLLKAITATSLISGLETFDFTVFALFATTIGDQFFPSTDPMTSLLLAVGTFGVGFFTRPLGAVVIGAYADRVGRRKALTLTCLLMAPGTAAIGLCPPFSQIGLAAPLFVVMARLLQGLAAGGELGTAATYMLESGPVSSRGSRVSWQLAGQGSAAFLGACVALFLTRTLSPASLASWGWRIPFLVGVLVAPLGIYVRRRLDEIARPVVSAARARALWIELRREHGRTMMLAMLTMAWHTVTFYIVIFYMPSYMMRVMHMPATLGFRSTTLATLLLAVLSPLSGLLVDRLPRRKPLVLATSGATALLIYPVFVVIAGAQTVVPVLCGVGVVSMLVALGTSAGFVLVLEGLPASVRASGFTISLSIAVALFGGTAQFVVTALIKWTGNPLSAAWYVALACVTSFCALLLFDERRSVAGET
jgi:MFS transporter, MHS family, proline/betaine transporter